MKSYGKIWPVNHRKMSTLQIQKKMKDNIQINLRMILEWMGVSGMSLKLCVIRGCRFVEILLLTGTLLFE
jgi:hypothetical protein